MGHNNQPSGGGGHWDKYGEVCCGCLCFSNPNLTLFALLFLGNAQEKERRRPQRGIRMASDTRCGCEAEEKVCPRVCFFTLNCDLIQSPHLLLPLQDKGAEGEAPAAARNTDGLGHETWLRGGGKVVLAYAFPTTLAGRRKGMSLRTLF